jgi:hypothetical protein
MFLCDVVTGKQHHVSRHQVFQRPPAGFDSVVLDANASNKMQDEYVVYNDEAVLPH